MNLTRVLNNALPDIPARNLLQLPPRLDPGANFREHIEDGKPIIRAYIPSAGFMFIFAPQQWKLAQLFDGKRTYEEIAEKYSQELGTQYDTDEVRKFAGDLEAIGFWYKTAQEKNISYMKQSLEERRKKVKARSKWADLSDVTFPAFNPDYFLTWAHSHTKFFYSTRFTLLTLCAFSFSAGITVTHWTEIGRDTVEFYDFTSKTWGDVFVLYVLQMFVVAVHEFAHAHACKHCGGRVPAMGFALVYLTPAFYTDTTEGSVTGTRFQRFIIYVAGVWSELILCSIATPIWWGTPPDTLVHNAAYFVMMITGIMSLVLNWNPLMKLDGYFMLCEIVEIRDLKEESTAFVSAWVKKTIWRLPVEVPYVPKRRRTGYIVYSMLSGIYSYMVLFILARFAGNIVRNFSPEWGFIPEIVVAFLIFRSRIRLLVNFMKFLYLDKKDRVAAWFTPQRTAGSVLAAVLLLVLPIWRESVSGRFLLEPVNAAVVRTRVAGTLAGMEAREGQKVKAGEVLAELRNLSLQSEYEDARARLLVASDRANAAALKYSDYGVALKERENLDAQYHHESEAHAKLQLITPISGTVVTPRLQELLGSTLPAGSDIVEIADLSSMRARIYISEYDLSKVRLSNPAVLQVQGFVRKWRAQALFVSAKPTEMDSRLIGAARLTGMNPPHFYLVDLAVQNPDEVLKSGMTGYARIYGKRRSLAWMAWEAFSNFWARKLW